MLTRSRTSRLAAAGALVLATTVLSSCGFNFATDKVYTPAEGVNNRDERVDVLNAAIIATADGKGTFVASLSNNETPAFENGEFSDVDDKLTAIEAVDGAQVTADFQPVDVKGGQLTKLADGEGIPVEGEGVKLGDYVRLRFTFENANPVTLNVPVIPNNHAFEGQDGTTTTPTELPEGYEPGTGIVGEE